jgi:hypothetical protein
MRRNLFKLGVAVMIACSVVSLKAMVYHTGWMGVDGSQVYCYAMMDFSEDFTSRGIEMWLYGPNDEVLAAGAYGDSLHHVQLEVRADSVGSGTYRCHVEFTEIEYDTERGSADYAVYVN